MARVWWAACILCSVLAIGTAPAAADEPPPDRLTVGSENGYFRPGLLVQGWTLADFPVAGPGGEDAVTFRLRRTEFKIRGDIVPSWVSYELMIDPAKVQEWTTVTIPVNHQDPPPTDPATPESVDVRQPTSPIAVLQDVRFILRVPYANLHFGQFKIPVSLEGVSSSAALLFPERSPAARAYGDMRDIGLIFTYAWDWFSYTAGVFNGNGQDRLDNDLDKDLALRLEAYPLAGLEAGKLTIGAVAYATVGERVTGRERYEADLRYEYAGLTVHGEFLYGRSIRTENDVTTITPSLGAFGMIAYRLLDYELAARFSYLDPNLDEEPAASNTLKTDELMQIDGGFNWYLAGNAAKVQLAYSRLQYDTVEAGNRLTLSVQGSF